MNKNLRKFLLFASLSILFYNCNKSDDAYEPIQNSVKADLTLVPYPKLSDYNFFVGELKNLTPNTGVLLYKPASSLFTDYAKKSRFVWLPSGTKASFNAETAILDLPVGAVIIKNFYYNNMMPSNSKRIMETRLMIRKVNGWTFAEYVWNAEQTDAFLSPNGSNEDITFVDNGVTRTANYRFPSNTECFICHKTNDQAYPIGIKPQNLNFNLNYGNETKNQLQKWIDSGYLDSANIPSSITSVVDFEDTSKPIELRLRSYLDINCAHCHKQGSHCDYRPLRLAFSETASQTNIGVCVDPQENINSNLTKIIAPANKNRSVMYYRLNATDESVRMPLLGRSIVHEEGVLLLEQYINSLQPCN